MLPNKGRPYAVPRRRKWQLLREYWVAPALSPYLFFILMDVLTEGLRKDVPESMMFADDIVLCGGKEVDMTGYLVTWKLTRRERGESWKDNFLRTLLMKLTI